MYLKAKRNLRLLKIVFLLHGKQDTAYNQAGKQVLADHNQTRGYFRKQSMLLFREPYIEGMTKICSRKYYEWIVR